MKNHFQNKLLLALYLLLSSLASLVAQAADEPDISGFWTVKFEQTPSGTELFEKLPEDAIFINDAGGGELAEGDFCGIELT